MKMIPRKGDTVMLLKDVYGEALLPAVPMVVEDLLATQFTAIGEDGHQEYLFYTDYKEKFNVM